MVNSQYKLCAEVLRRLEKAQVLSNLVLFEGVPVVVPHPAVYVLHKLIVAQRRKELPKAAKDKRDALLVLDMLTKKGDMAIVQSIFAGLPKNWKKLINKSLSDEGRESVFQQ